MIRHAIIDFVHDPTHHDQEAEGKNKFLQTGKYEKTKLTAVGIANPTLKKEASYLYNQYKTKFIDAIIDDLDKIMTDTIIYEEQLLAIYLLEKYRKQFDRTTFDYIDNWIDYIDYWAISDHLAINLLGHFSLDKQWYQARLQMWLRSDHYWRRRQALTAYLQPARHQAHYIDFVLPTIELLLPENNYYIQKSIPWILRESYRKHKKNHDVVFTFLSKNMQYFSKTMLREAIKYLDTSSQTKLLELYDTT